MQCTNVATILKLAILLVKFCTGTYWYQVVPGDRIAQTGVVIKRLADDCPPPLSAVQKPFSFLLAHPRPLTWSAPYSFCKKMMNYWSCPPQMHYRNEPKASYFAGRLSTLGVPQWQHITPDTRCWAYTSWCNYVPTMHRAICSKRQL